MKVLWAKSPMTAGDVIEILADLNDWSPKTIRTLLARLVQKEVLTLDSNSEPYVYSPLVDFSSKRSIDLDRIDVINGQRIGSFYFSR